jgi:hypothetical protein
LLFTLFFKIFILFICAYNVWVSSSPFPYHSQPPPSPSLPQQKLFCPYL